MTNNFVQLVYSCKWAYSNFGLAYFFWSDLVWNSYNVDRVMDSCFTSAFQIRDQFSREYCWHDWRRKVWLCGQQISWRYSVLSLSLVGSNCSANMWALDYYTLSVWTQNSSCMTYSNLCGVFQQFQVITTVYLFHVIKIMPWSSSHRWQEILAHWWHKEEGYL